MVVVDDVMHPHKLVYNGFRTPMETLVDPANTPLCHFLGGLIVPWELITRGGHDDLQDGKQGCTAIVRSLIQNNYYPIPSIHDCGSGSGGGSGSRFGWPTPERHQCISQFPIASREQIVLCQPSGVLISANNASLV